ncbi:MAG: hypothetical protein ACP5FH_11280 [Terracidiphilus sp.]
MQDSARNQARQAGDRRTFRFRNKLLPINIPLNQEALRAFEEWRSQQPDAKPEGSIFPTEKLVFKSAGPRAGAMAAYDVDPSKPPGAWKRAWRPAEKQAGVECRIHDLRHRAREP